MSGCCASSPVTDAALAIVCPSCQARGLSVDFRTVKALLTESALARVRAASYRFCRTPECSVVYYDETGAVYPRSDVRVRVWHKEPVGDRPLCYCFAETEATIRDEFARSGRSDAVLRVRAHIEAERCACDVRNPRGACCLGDLTTAVKRIGQESLAEKATP